MFAKTPLQLGIAVLAGALVLAPVSPAHADAKGISATACQPFLPTTYSQALFKDNAIYNPTAANQRVICPISKDANVNWTSGNVLVFANIKAGATPGKVSCTVYGGGSSFGLPQVAFTATSEVLSAGDHANFTIPNIADPAGSLTIEGWNILCTLNPGMSLGGFYVEEKYDTNVDE